MAYKILTNILEDKPFRIKILNVSGSKYLFNGTCIRKIQYLPQVPISRMIPFRKLSDITDSLHFVMK